MEWERGCPHVKPEKKAKRKSIPASKLEFEQEAKPSLMEHLKETERTDSRPAPKKRKKKKKREEMLALPLPL